MMSQFREIISDAMSAIRCTAGVPITYWTDSSHWFKLAATPGQTTFTLDDGNGIVVDYTSRDFLVSACDMLFNGQYIVPADGHVIKETVGNAVHVYAVRREDGEQPWRYSDHGRTQIRIHTKLASKALL
jgi:hypothetical protein